MKVDGGCHCGRITFEAEIDPAKVLICHCTDCQSLSGSAFRTVVRVPTTAFRLLSGSQESMSSRLKAGQGSPKPFVPTAEVPSMGRMSAIVRSSTGFAWGLCASVMSFRQNCKSGVARRTTGSVIWTPLEKLSNMRKPNYDGT